MTIFKIIIAIIAARIISFLTDIKINNKIKQKIKQFLCTSDLNTEIIFNECSNKNESFALEESKYLFFLPI